MPRIPVRQQRPLASSLVGTAGLDTSGQQIAQSISSTAGRLATQIQRQRRASEKDFARRQEVADRALANRTALDFEVDSADAYDQHQQDYKDYRGTLSDRTQPFVNVLRQDASNYSSQITSPRAKQLFDESAQRIIAQQTGREIRSASSNQLSLALADTTESISSLTDRAYSVGGSQEVLEQRSATLQQLIDNAEATIANSETLFNPKVTAQLRREAPEAIAMAFAKGSIESNAGEALDLLDAGGFEGLLGQPEQDKLRKMAGKAFLNQRKQADIDRQVDVLQQNQGLYNKYINRDLTLADLEDLPEDSEDKEVFEQLILEDAPPEEENLLEVAGIENDFLNLLEQDGKPVEQLQQFARFHKRIIQAKATGGLTRSRANTYIRKLASPFFENVEDWKANAIFYNPFRTDGFRQALLRMKQHTKSLGNGRDLSDRAALTLDFFSRLDDKGDNSAANVRAAVDETIQADLQRRTNATTATDADTVRLGNGALVPSGRPQGQPSAPADNTVKPEYVDTYVMNPKTGQKGIVRTLPDGSKLWLPQ